MQWTLSADCAALERADFDGGGLSRHLSLVIAYLLYGRCVAMIGAARAGRSIHLIPMSGVGLSARLPGEDIYLYQVAGVNSRR
ncbi:hypothetical protein FJU30_08525 [Affinibrenneria salicis]|uniref:Uncharacterized protein n=1 Tax=Affinibrenneria salicis TaxID=2590031 RepID=A0A5J5G2Y8_9GAMM|nr:hypothetical protein [Affinibrenneria salicis]KAA9001265.1 hypothetical protein FJU30_08525 [Affinibrenneria salicis]